MQLADNSYLKLVYFVENNIFNTTNNLIKLFNTLGGLLAVFFVLMPLFYLVLLPVGWLVNVYIFKRFKRNINNIEIYFNSLPDKDKLQFVEHLKKANRQFNMQNKDLLKNAKKTFLYVKPIYKQAEKLNNLMFDLEDNLESLISGDIVFVPEHSDKELKQFIFNNQTNHNLAL